MYLNYQLENKYNKIFVIGSGFSLDQFDWNLIDKNSIVICVNNTICAVPKEKQIHYVICNDIQSLRPCVIERIREQKDCQIVLGRNFGSHIECSDWWYEDGESRQQSLLHLSSDIFSLPIILMGQQADVRSLEKGNWINDFYMEEAIEFRLFNTGNSGSMAFSLAFVLEEFNYNKIEEVHYVGIDCISGKEYNQRKYYAKCMLKWVFKKELVVEDYSNLEYKDDVFDSTVFCMALISSIYSSFYRKLICHSLFDLTGKWEEIQEIKENVINYCNSIDSQTFKNYLGFYPAYEALIDVQKIRGKCV